MVEAPPRPDGWDVAAVGSALLARHLWTYRDKPGADWFVASLACQAVWSGAYGFALLVFDPYWLRWALEVVVWVAFAGTGFYFAAFALAYTGRSALLDRGWRLVAAAPAAIGAIVVTNPLHGIAWNGFALDPVGGLATVSYTLHPWTVAGTTVGILLVSVGSLLLFDTVVSYGPLYRGEAVAVGLSTIPPVAAHLVWLYGVGPVPQLNLVTVLFLPHVVLDAYAFVGSDMFEFHPATRRAGERAAIDDLGAPVVIVDERDRVVTLNAAAREGFGVDRGEALTRSLDALVGDVRIVGLGVGHAFLPCPITFPAYLYAFAIGEPLRAAFLLSLLGLGTFPTLFVYGTALGSISTGRRRALHRVLGAAFLVLGYIPLAHGLMLVGIHIPHPTVPIYQPLG